MDASDKPACRFDPLPDGEVPAGEVLGRIEGERGGYVIQAGRMVDGNLELEPGHYLIVPNLHVADVDSVIGWSDLCAVLKRCIPEFVGVFREDWPSYIQYDLRGEEMGRTIPDHGHTHVVIGKAADVAEKFAAVGAAA